MLSFIKTADGDFSPGDCAHCRNFPTILFVWTILHIAFSTPKLQRSDLFIAQGASPVYKVKKLLGVSN